MKTKLQEALDFNGQLNQDIAIIFGLLIIAFVVIVGSIFLFNKFKTRKEVVYE